MHTNLVQTDIDDLADFLSDSARPVGTLRLPELQGFLFAVACSPEIIPPSDWLRVISNDKDISFRNKAEAQRTLGQIKDLNNAINMAVLGRSKAMPLGCEFQTNIEDNFGKRSTISQWCRGFLVGHDWLRDVWSDYLMDEMESDFASATMILSFFATRELAEMFHLDSTTTPRSRKPREPFDVFAEKMRSLFPDALSAYAHMGRTISEVSMDSRG